MKQNEISINDVIWSKVDMRFMVSQKTYEETEEMSDIAMNYIRIHWEEHKKLSDEEVDLLFDKLYKNYKLPGILDLTLEEVMKL